MKLHRHLALVPVVLACCFGCDQNPFSKGQVSEDEVSMTESSAAGPIDQAKSLVATGEAATEQFQKRFGELFENVLPTLQEARGLVDRHSSLPDRSRIPFTEDKTTNSAAINELLDQAIESLQISEVSDVRQEIRDANLAISESRDKIADFQRQRVSASWEKDQSRIEKVNPFELSKEALDESIKLEREAIENQEDQLAKLKETFAAELEKIGVKVDDDGIDSLLSSVSGDEIVTMAVVFDNIKQVATQLQTLTEESGETLDVSKRYYGMYVVMVQVMDRIQKTFVRDVEQKHIPKLKEFAAKADQNVAQAQSLIDANGGDKETLTANIASNRLTRKTAELYIQYLNRNADLISQENKLAEKNLATAMNTYDTVKLSSDVATLMSTGRRDFDTLMKLKVPSLREFNNQAIRKEFERMTGELRSGN